MATWIQQLTAQPGNYQPILQTLTPGDGECLQAIYDQLEDHATITGNTLLSYVQQSICVALEQDGVTINLPSIATLKAVGVILTTDNVHLGLTPLGYGFMQTMLAEE
jgi:hypothetical protein